MAEMLVSDWYSARSLEDRQVAESDALALQLLPGMETAAYRQAALQSRANTNLRLEGPLLNGFGWAVKG